jgi:REP element-mobilizing transposase RayT
MIFSEGELYHIYNRGNNRQKVFFNSDNYIYFLKKIRSCLLPSCDILAYCLMPTHFHFLIHSDTRSISTKSIAGKEKNVLSEGIKNLLSSYTQAINKQNQTTGSLFQQNTKAKLIEKSSKQYDLICFHYIHQNPLNAKLVKKMEDWPYSLFQDYCGFRNETLCNMKSAIQLLDINMKTFYEDSYKIINDDDLKNIF